MKIETQTQGMGLKGVLMVVAMFIVFMGVLWELGGVYHASAQDRTLQETVETAQRVYDQNQALAVTALKTYCESWRQLGLAKNDLATSLKMQTSGNAYGAELCQNLTVPTSF